MPINAYTRICASKFATAKIECSFEMGKETTLVHHLFWCWWYICLTFSTLDIYVHKSRCTMYWKLFHASAVKLISKCSDKICRQGQVFSHFASDFSRSFKFNIIMSTKCITKTQKRTLPAVQPDFWSTASEWFVCDAGWHACHVNALGPQDAQFVCQASHDPASCRAM